MFPRRCTNRSASPDAQSQPIGHIKGPDPMCPRRGRRDFYISVSEPLLILSFLRSKAFCKGQRRGPGGGAQGVPASRRRWTEESRPIVRGFGGSTHHAWIRVYAWTNAKVAFAIPYRQQLEACSVAPNSCMQHARLWQVHRSLEGPDGQNHVGMHSNVSCPHASPASPCA